MRSGWQAKRLGDVVLHCGTIDPTKSPTKKFRYVDVSSVSNTTFEIESVSEIVGRDAPSRARRLINEGDVIFATIRPTLKRIAVVPKHLDGEVCSTGYFVFRPAAELYNRFLYYYLFTDDFQGAMERIQTGASYPAVTDAQVKSQKIAFPEISEQKRIVAILDEALEGIERAIANTEKNLANAREVFESYLNAALSRADGWVERRIDDADLLQIIDGDRGANYPSKADFFESGFCLFLNTKNVRPDGFNFDTTAFITKEKDSQLRKGKLKRRDVVLTTRGTIGNIALYDDTVEFDHIRINSGMLIFRPNEKVILSEYLFEMLRSGIVKSQIAQFVSGAAQPQLPIHTLSKFSIPVPKTLADQKRIVDRLRAISSESKRLEGIYQQKHDALEELKQAILQRAFAGELTARSVEDLHEAAQ